METRASYLLVGSFVLVLVAGAFAFAIWLAKAQFEREFDRYDISFAGNVNGLRVGSPVTYRGLPVGEVIDVAIDPDGSVRATVEISSDTPVRADTSASLVLTGITGGVNVLLSGGSPDASALTAAEGERPVIPSRASALAQLIEGAPELVTGLNTLVSRASALLSPANQAAFSRTLQNLSVLSGSLADSSADLQLLLNDGAGTVANLRDASARIVELADRFADSSDELIESTDRALDAVADAAGNVNAVIQDNRDALDRSIESVGGMAEEMRNLVADNREAVTEFSNTALLEFTALVNDTRDLVASLRRLATDVESDPARFLFGDQQQGYEAGE